jgi:hypothetical protein
MILNSNGTPVWYQGAPGAAINVELTGNNTIAWAPSLGPGVGSEIYQPKISLEEGI